MMLVTYFLLELLYHRKYVVRLTSKGYFKILVASKLWKDL